MRFSEDNIKKMRTFAEFWSQFINRSPLANEISLEALQQEIECDSLNIN